MAKIRTQQGEQKRGRRPPASRETTEAAEARAIRREKVAELLSRHRTYREIAVELGCSIATVSEDRAALIASYAERYRDAAEDMIEQETMRLDQMERSALDAWKAKGNPKTLEVALRIAARKHALRGLDKPLKVAPTNPEGDEPYAGLSDEQLERQLRKLQGKTE